MKKLCAVLLLLLAAVFFPLASCASLPGDEPLKLVCEACTAIVESGICELVPSRDYRALTPCPEGQKHWVVNFRAVVEGGEEPRIECRR